LPTERLRRVRFLKTILIGRLHWRVCMSENPSLRDGSSRECEDEREGPWISMVGLEILCERGF
jgi:hypothetical protein